jgi:hypothetical protein
MTHSPHRWVLRNDQFVIALDGEPIRNFALRSRLGLVRLKEVIKHGGLPLEWVRNRIAAALGVSHNTVFTDLFD